MKSIRFLAVLKIVIFELLVICFFCGELDCAFAQEIDSTKAAIDSSQQNLPSPKGAMIRSLVFPGWGQWYNGKKIKAGLVFLTEAGIIGNAVYWHEKAADARDKLHRDLYIDNRNLSFWYLGAAILLSMADAYVDAHLAGFDVSPDLGAMLQERKWTITLSYCY